MPDVVPPHVKQLRAVMVAEFQLKQRLERLEWEETILYPALEKAKLDPVENFSITEYVPR